MVPHFKKKKIVAVCDTRYTVIKTRSSIQNSTQGIILTDPKQVWFSSRHSPLRRQELDKGSTQSDHR